MAPKGMAYHDFLVGALSLLLDDVRRLSMLWSSRGGRGPGSGRTPPRPRSSPVSACGGSPASIWARTGSSDSSSCQSWIASASRSPRWPGGPGRGGPGCGARQADRRAASGSCRARGGSLVVREGVTADAGLLVDHRGRGLFWPTWKAGCHRSTSSHSSPSLVAERTATRPAGSSAGRATRRRTGDPGPQAPAGVVRSPAPGPGAARRVRCRRLPASGAPATTSPAGRPARRPGEGGRGVRQEFVHADAGEGVTSRYAVEQPVGIEEQGRARRAERCA